MGNTERRLVRKRKNKRQRRILFSIGGCLLGAVFLWGALHAGPKNSWLNIPSGFYQPNLVLNRPLLDTHPLEPLPLKHEDSHLRQKLESEIQQYSTVFKPHLFYYNLQDGSYVNLNGDEAVSAASVIKLPILLEYFRQIDQGTITPFTHLMYEDFEQAAGSGMLQYRPTGQPLLAQDVAKMMIQLSDNTCTNMLIYRLGGAIGLNQIFSNLGLRGTHIGNWLPDLEGTNVISMRDMATVLYNIKTSDILSSESRAEAIEILKGTHNRHLLPALLPRNTVIAHKTGDIGTALGNTGLIMLPSGQDYIVAVQVDRPYNDYTAKTMIQNLSKIIYDSVKDRPALASSSTEQGLVNN